MKIEVTPEEYAQILDGLAALPLGRTYNLFTRLMGEYRQGTQIAPQPVAVVNTASEL